MGDNKIKEGDQVAWNWGGGAPGGTADKVKESEVTMETKRGNQVKKKGEPGNPAVYIKRSGHDVVKKASELKVKSKGPKHGKDDSKSSKEMQDTASEKKRKATSSDGNDQKAPNGPAKKQKTESKEKPNQTKKRSQKSAGTDDGQPRRSRRLATGSK